jgi:DUF971 family protein
MSLLITRSEIPLFLHINHNNEIIHQKVKIAFARWTPSDTGMVKLLSLTNIQLIGTDLAIVWNDGMESYFPLEPLRKACPCATCAGEPDVTGEVVRPLVSYNEKSFTLRTWKMTGGYALQPIWADGHDTGLYSFQYLRKLGGG